MKRNAKTMIAIGGALLAVLDHPGCPSLIFNQLDLGKVCPSPQVSLGGQSIMFSMPP